MFGQGWLYDWFLEWLAEKTLAVLGELLALMTARFFVSPDVTGLPQVQQLAGWSLAVVDAVYVLAVTAAGLMQFTGGVESRFAVKDLLPRLVFGFVAANFGVEACRLLIEVANAVTSSLAGEAAAGPRVVEQVRDQLEPARAHQATMLLVTVIGLVVAVLFVQLLLGCFTRIAVLIVLAGLAPVALACHGLPQTQPVAVLWWRTLAGCLTVPALQAVFLTLGAGLISGPAPVIPQLLDLPDSSGMQVANLLIALCLLMVAARIPKLVGRYLIQQPSTNAGVMVRAVLMQAVTRRLGLPGR
ncbi:conjugal transfer protein TrbL family protein [Actinoplanes subglobosus]|uniref:Conjugal transfer protein TrbL family protein n=1 Tax=Actinoplanes subglobosus TaxID=1547892 RepID=A0ABV8JBM0_9ACTN